jgi:hypothetical protein
VKHIGIISLLLVLFSACSKTGNEISLAGEWQLRIDSAAVLQDNQIATMAYDHTIMLPGTLDEAGYGAPLQPDSSLTKEVMSTLARKFNYVGPAYYSREITIPEQWEGQRILLTLERIIWKSTVWVDGVQAGTANSLTTPHYYDLTDLLEPGTHTLTICIDNRRQVNINKSDFAHAYTNQTQIKWNGILGDMLLRAVPDAHISQVIIYPEYDAGVLTGIIGFAAEPAAGQRVKLNLRNPKGAIVATAGKEITGIETPFRMEAGDGVRGWSEIDPAVYELEVLLLDENGHNADSRRESFGFRNIEKRNGHLVLNGEKLFLRGTLECAIFPLTGHPPTDKEGWRTLLLKAQDYGLNHLRFHSWCPPEAAFEVADELGFYLQPELPSWSLTYGEDLEVVAFMEAEADRILREYGNHPSFVMFCMGNELIGDYGLINGLVKRLKDADDRRLYTATAFTFQEDHWGFHEPYDDFYITQWTDSGWVRGQGVFDQYSPDFRHNYSKAIEHIEIPVISHEIGQYTVFPNLEEIRKYTGVLDPMNFKAVRNDLREKGRLEKAPEFTEATGKFATILYKEEIERAYKTPGLSGFQLLDLHDFPGQGTALVGILDAFWDSKGFTSGEEFRRYCSPVVPLLWFDKAVYAVDETFVADAGMSNYFGDLPGATLSYTITDRTGNLVGSGTFSAGQVDHGNVERIGTITQSFSEVTVPNMLTIELSLEDTPYANSWQIWVYDHAVPTDEGNVLVTRSLREAQEALHDGRKVLLSPTLDHIKGIAGKYVPVFWSPVHFPNQPGTMGILCDPEHPVFDAFPTEFHSNWQWWDIVKFSKTLVIDDIEVQPLITVMDNFYKNRSMTSLFETKAGNGLLLLSSFDLTKNLANRPATRQLLKSILLYMQSETFAPEKNITMDELEGLFEMEKTEIQDAFSIYN